MQAVFSMSQLQYFQLSTIVELYKKNQETQKFCPLALIFHLATYLIFIVVRKSTYPERMVLVTQYKKYFHVSAPLKRFVKSLSDETLRLFLQFTTGSDLLVVDCITIDFTTINGLLEDWLHIHVVQF